MRVTKPLSRSLFVRSQAKILRMKRTMNGTGTRLPSTEARIAVQMFSPRTTPNGIAPRSSTTGTIATRNVSKMSFMGMTPPPCRNGLILRFITVLSPCGASFSAAARMR